MMVSDGCVLVISCLNLCVEKCVGYSMVLVFLDSARVCVTFDCYLMCFILLLNYE